MTQCRVHGLKGIGREHLWSNDMIESQARSCARLEIVTRGDFLVCHTRLLFLYSALTKLTRREYVAVCIHHVPPFIPDKNQTYNSLTTDRRPTVSAVGYICGQGVRLGGQCRTCRWLSRAYGLLRITSLVIGAIPPDEIVFQKNAASVRT